MTKEAIGDINLEMLKEFSEAHGISGNEKEVSRIMKKWMQPYADEITYDNNGSILGVQKGTENVSLMIAGHMDEVDMYYQAKHWLYRHGKESDIRGSSVPVHHMVFPRK